jgi:hypothetical protein
VVKEARSIPGWPASTTICAEADAVRIGGLTKGDILSRVKAQLPALKKCCRGVAPVVYLHWTIKCDGAVESVFIGTDAVRGTSAGTCLESVIRTWHYPTQSGPSTPAVQIPIPCD